MNKAVSQDESEASEAPEKIASVRAYFEKPAAYLGRQADIRIRAEAVQHFVGGKECNRILDIGCGDGSISLPLLKGDNSLTLLDLSESMLSVVRSRIPPGHSNAVQLLHGDFMGLNFQPDSYDLIICLGVLAHVDSPARFIQKIATLLTPGGSLILEFTDARHFVGRMTRLVLDLRHLLKPPRYPVNLFSAKEVATLCGAAGLRLESVFRYTWWALPWMFSQETLYKTMRLVYGSPVRSKNSWLGNEYICRLTRRLESEP